MRGNEKEGMRQKASKRMTGAHDEETRCNIEADKALILETICDA